MAPQRAEAVPASSDASLVPRSYLMNSISEYFGSGHRSSATTPLELVGDRAGRVHRRDDLVAHVLRELEALDRRVRRR